MCTRIKKVLDAAGCNTELNHDFYLSDIVAYELEEYLPWPLVKLYFQYLLLRKTCSLGGVPVVHSRPTEFNSPLTLCLTADWHFCVRLLPEFLCTNDLAPYAAAPLPADAVADYAQFGHTPEKWIE